MENQSQSIERFVPEDLVFKEILPRVPTNSVLDFKRVSKSWQDRIASDSTFIADHTAHQLALANNATELFKIIGLEYSDDECYRIFKLYAIGHGSSKLVEIDTSYIWDTLKKPVDKLFLRGCGNGLVCLKPCFEDGTCELVLWNPLTREFKCLPKPGVDSFHDNGEVEYYFGTVKDSDDYKVVCLEYDYDVDYEVTRRDIHVQVFSKSSGNWRQLDVLSGLGPRRVRGQGLMVDGTMNWLIRYTNRGQESLFHLLSFDLRTENFQELEGPRGESYKSIELMEWKGCPTVVLASCDFTEWRFYMKTRNGEKNSSSNLYCWKRRTIVIPSFRPDRYLGVLGDQLVLESVYSADRYLYDLTSRKITDLEDDIEHYMLVFYTISDHIPTLVSPN